MSVIIKIASVVESLKKQTNIQPTAVCIGPMEWLELKQEISEQMKKDIPVMRDCTIFNLPIYMKATPGIEAILPGANAGAMATIWRRHGELEEQAAASNSIN